MAGISGAAGRCGVLPGRRAAGAVGEVARRTVSGQGVPPGGGASLIHAPASVCCLSGGMISRGRLGGIGRRPVIPCGQQECARVRVGGGRDGPFRACRIRVDRWSGGRIEPGPAACERGPIRGK